MSAEAVLALPVFLALAARCAPAVPAERLAAYAQVESRFRPAALNVNGAGGGPRGAPDMEGAVALAERLVAAGRSVDLGLMQVNSRHLQRFRLTVAEAMEPCRNVAVGAFILADAERAAACIYNSGRADCRRPSGTNGYPEKIRAAAARVAGPPPADAPLPPTIAAGRRPCAPSWALWARCPAPPIAAAATADGAAAARRGEGPTGDRSPPPAAPTVPRGQIAMGAAE